MRVFFCAVLLFASAVATDISELSVDDTQKLLKDWNLDAYLGRDFKKLSYDGSIMEVLDMSDFQQDRERFPDATVAHWKKLLRAINLKRAGHLSQRQLRQLDAVSDDKLDPVVDDTDGSKPDGDKPDEDKPDGDGNSQLMNTDNFIGLRIVQDKSLVALGPDGDVSLLRTGKGTLSVRAESVNFDTISVKTILLNGKDLMSLIPPPDLCAKDNGGCHIARNCANVDGGKKCGPCPAGFDNDGETGCKPGTERSADLHARLTSLPSDLMTAASSASCDVDGLAALSHRYPPVGVEYADITRNDKTYTWTVSGQEYGNGVYTAQSSSVYDLGGGGEWPASGAFDHQRGESNLKNGWHTTSDGDPWITLELPEAIRLDYYTISARYSCSCAPAQSPTTWDILCVDDPNNAVKLDTRSGQSFPIDNCRLYPATAPAEGMSCKKFKFHGPVTSMSELAFYGGQKCPSGWKHENGDCKDVNECATDNGGCDPRRECTNTAGDRTCGPCPDNLQNDGDAACKLPDRSSTLASAIAGLPSSVGGQDSTGTCDPTDIQKFSKRYPPTVLERNQISQTDKTYTWTVSGQEYGNGVYTAQANNVYDLGGGDEWPATGPFDHKSGESGLFSGWHTSGGKNWVTLELPEPIRLDFYTLAARTACCESQNPSEWQLYCVDEPDKKVLLDTRSGQSMGVGQCKVYPASTPAEGILCSKFEWDVTLVSMGELGLFGTPM